MSVNLIKFEERRWWWQSCYIWAVALLQLKKPLNHRCQMSAQQVAPMMVLHSVYVVMFVALTRSIQHVNFIFDELKDLWRGVLVSTFFVGFCLYLCVLNSGGLECGFYVIKYMDDVLRSCSDDEDLEKVFRSPREEPFTDEEIQEIRDKWANYFTSKCMT